MKIELYRGGRPQGTWLEVEHMIVDLQNNRIMLEPGDNIIVSNEKQRVEPRPRYGTLRHSPLRLVRK